MKKAYIYVRVSKDELKSLGQQKTSILQQKEDGISDARRHGYTDYEVVIDQSVSGTTPLKEREFSKITKADDVDAIFVRSIDRLHRSSEIANQIWEFMYRNDIKLFVNGVSFDYTSPNGKFLFEFFSSISEMNRSMIRSNIIRSVNKRMESKIFASGSNQLGYKNLGNNKVEINQEQAKLVTEIFERIAAGESQTGIASELNNRGAKKLRPGKWYDSSIKRIITNVRYYGMQYFRTEDSFLDPDKPQLSGQKRVLFKPDLMPECYTLEKSIVFPAIVSEELWLKANRKLQEAKVKVRTAISHLLTYATSCAYCNYNGKHRDLYTVYRAPGKASKYSCRTIKKISRRNCPDSISIVAESLETAVENYVKDVASKVIELRQQKDAKTSELLEERRIFEIDTEIRQLNQKKAVIQDRILESLGTEDERQNRDLEIKVNNKILHLSKEKAELQDQINAKKFVDGIDNNLTELGQWDRLTAKERQELIPELVKILAFSNCVVVLPKLSQDEGAILPLIMPVKRSRRRNHVVEPTDPEYSFRMQQLERDEFFHKAVLRQLEGFFDGNAARSAEMRKAWLNVLCGEGYDDVSMLIGEKKLVNE